MTSDEQSFHLEEYKQIRAEVGVLLARVENLFKYAVVVTATTFAWLVTQSVGVAEDQSACMKLPWNIVKSVWFVPPMFVVLSALLAFAAYWRVNQMGTYLKQIEDQIGIEALGWQKYLKKKWPLVTVTTIVVWLFLLWGTWHAASLGLSVFDSKQPKACTSEAKK